MAYLVPAELPKSCCTCPFGICKFSHPFFAREKPNRKGYVCAFDKTNRVLETHIDDFDTRAEWCPLKEVKIIEAVVKDGKDGGIMANKYVDVDLLKEEFEQTFDMQDLYLPAHFFDVVDSMPSADVQEVRHAKWFGTVCTNCGESTSDYYDCDYCPHCGARMDGEE